jgi:chaperonin cofactor prefoldin
LSDKLKANLTTLYENFQILCSLIDDKKTKPSTLLDLVIATWAIINLPDDYKLAGELIIKKCKIEKATPSLKQTIEELRLYIQRNKSSQGSATSQALAASRQPFPNPEGSKCLNGEHNPLTQHKESECNQLKYKNKSQTTDKIEKVLLSAFSINLGELIFDSGASSPMFNSKHFFTKLRKHNDQVFQADGSSLQVTGIGTVRLDLSYMVLHLQNTLLVPKLSSNLISQSTFLRSGHIIRSNGEDGFAVVDDQHRIVLDGSYASGNLIIWKSSPNACVAVQPVVSAQIIALH